MGNAKYIGRVEALAFTLGIGSFRRAATRMTVSIGVAVLVVIATAVPASTASASSSDVPPPDKTALIMGGTTIPTWNDADVEVIMIQFIAPTHPGQTIEPVAVTTPNEFWPFTGVGRLACLALCPPSIFGPGGAAWPDEPWWKLSGLFDLTIDQSVQAGVADLETAMAAHGNDHLVIYGYSQGAVIAIREKRKLAEQYPAGTAAPDIDFVLSADLNLPNGGLLARFPGLYVPILDLSFNGPEPTDTQFDTVVITRQYDGLADFPLYPINAIADLNALLGVVYVHLYPFDVSLAPDALTSTFQDTHGDTSYYFFETQDLPLFGPLRTLGVPESLIDVVEPFFRVLVELGYDRSIPPWEPTPARLIPLLDPGKVADDLLNAIGEGINNAAALIGSPPPLSIPAPVTADQGEAVEQLALGPESIVETVRLDVAERVSQVLATVGSQPPQPPAVSQHDTIDEGINSAAALSGSPPPLSTPAPLTADQGEAVEQSGAALDTTLNRVSRDVGDGVSQVLPALGSQLPKPPAVTPDDLAGSKRTVSRELAAARDQINDTIGEVNSVIGNGRTIMRSADDRGSTETTARPERKTSMRDAVTKASCDINKAVTPVSDSIRQALSGGQDDGDSDNNRGDEAE